MYEAAAVDGAGPFRQLFSITLPMVRVVMLVVLLFRALDAVRVFDLIYVLTHGGPGVATEPISLYIYAVLLQNLDFGKGAALSILVFLITLGLCFAYARLVAEREP
jgi:multiple sugar transport system permease protein